MYDILATTSSRPFIEKTFKGEIVSYTEDGKLEKVVITEDGLFKADTFSFGTKIGSITNKGSSAFALLSNFEEDSKEHEVTLTRLKTLPCIQNKEIDKTKNGQKTKGIPSTWVQYEKENDFNNSLLVDKHPYFFIYLYEETRRNYLNHVKNFEKKCKQSFCMNLNTFFKKDSFTDEEIEFFELFEKKLPVIKSNSVMNKVCRRIEKLNSEIKFNKNLGSNSEVFEIYFNEDENWDWLTYKNVVKAFAKYKKEISLRGSMSEDFVISESFYDGEEVEVINTEDLREYVRDFCSNDAEALNYLVYYIYKDKDLESGKELVWHFYGDLMFKNIKNKSGEYFRFPVKCSKGDINYLEQTYKEKEIEYYG